MNVLNKITINNLNQLTKPGWNPTD